MADKKVIKSKAEDKKPVKKTIAKTKKKAEVVAEIAPIEADVKPEIEVKEVKATAKAGKRSAKAIKEAEEKEIKEERKAVKAETSEKPKVPVKPARTREERAGKKYREAAKLIEKGKVYNLNEALDLATKTSPVKFDATVELHVRLYVDPKQADQNIRGTVNLPEGSGKEVRVAVFAEDADVKSAKAAGADVAGGDDFLAQLDKNKLDFDVLITSPSLMPRLGKYAKVLGPKGLMPNPKSGTITSDIAKAVKSAKAGKVEYRVDSAGIIHLGVGKVSFGPDRLGKNASTVVSSIKAAKPASVKGAYIASSYITTSMGPSIKVNL